MTLKEANKKIEQLENEYEYWLKEKEKLLCLITPKSTDPMKEVVDGGKKSMKHYNIFKAEKKTCLTG